MLELTDLRLNFQFRSTPKNNDNIPNIIINIMLLLLTARDGRPAAAECTYASPPLLTPGINDCQSIVFNNLVLPRSVMRMQSLPCLSSGGRGFHVEFESSLG